MAGPSPPARLAALIRTAARARRRPAAAAGAVVDPAAADPAPVLLPRATPGTTVEGAAFDSLAFEAVARVSFEDRLERALQAATTVDDLLDVAERALAAIAPLAPTALLLVQPVTGRLAVAVEVGPDGAGPGCPATSPDSCAALRAGSTQVHDDSQAFDAYPHLRDRPGGPCSAVCVPLAFVGHTVGVLHRSGPPGTPPSSLAIAQLRAVATQVGGRLALLRALEADGPAAIDRVTGALDRATVEARALELARHLVPFCLAQCDLDGFEDYAATFGADTAERALRTVATASREILRPDDVVGRFGDDELLIVLPDTSHGEALRALERVREHLALSLTAAGLPPLTASFGVVESSMGRSLDELLVAADAAVTLAKDRGRNRVVVARENMLDDYPGVA